ncbi:MAG: UPF0175 family protein [Opitutaceae bacterium]|nr:UPF0175 family protein [Opitutaceae bacterium]
MVTNEQVRTLLAIRHADKHPSRMTLTVDYPPHLPDAMQMNREESEREARMALAAKFLETGKLSSGMATRLAGIDRVEFLSSHRQESVLKT